MTEQPPLPPRDPYVAPAGSFQEGAPQSGAPQPGAPQPGMAPAAYGGDGQFGEFAPPPWQPSAEAQTKKPRRGLIAAGVGVAVVVIGGAVALGMNLSTSSSSTSTASTSTASTSSAPLSQDELCKQASSGAGLVSQAIPGATAVVTPGGAPVAGVPTLPAGKSAGCTMTIRTSGVTVKGYVAIYNTASDASGFRALLVHDGYLQADGSAASATGTGPIVSPDGNTMILILSTSGKTFVEELSSPPGGG